MTYNYDFGVENDANIDFDELRIDVVARHIISSMPESFNAYDGTLTRAIVSAAERHDQGSKSGERIRFLRASGPDQKWLTCSLLDTYKEGEFAYVVVGEMDDHKNQIFVETNRITAGNLPQTVMQSMAPGDALEKYIALETHPDRIIKSIEILDSKIIIDLEPAEDFSWYD